MTSPELKDAKEFFADVVKQLPEVKKYPLKAENKKIVIVKEEV